MFFDGRPTSSAPSSLMVTAERDFQSLFGEALGCLGDVEGDSFEGVLSSSAHPTVFVTSLEGEGLPERTT